MQFDKFLFAIYITLLTLVPCSDFDSCVEQTVSAHGTYVANHHHSDGELDFCSPFCICACCHTQIAQPVDADFSNVVPVFDEPTSAWKTISFNIIPVTIWQPPKLT